MIFRRTPIDSSYTYLLQDGCKQKGPLRILVFVDHVQEASEEESAAAVFECCHIPCLSGAIIRHAVASRLLSAPPELFEVYQTLLCAFTTAACYFRSYRDSTHTKYTDHVVASPARCPRLQMPSAEAHREVLGTSSGPSHAPLL